MYMYTVASVLGRPIQMNDSMGSMKVLKYVVHTALNLS